MVSGSPPLRDSSTRTPYFSFLNASNIGEYLAGQQFHALAGQVVGQRPGLAAGQHHADAQLLLVAGQLLPDRLGAADDGEDAFLDVVPGLLGVQEMLLVLDDGGGRAGRGVARRGQADVLEQVADKVPEV